MNFTEDDLRFYMIAECYVYDHITEEAGAAIEEWIAPRFELIFITEPYNSTPEKIIFNGEIGETLGVMTRKEIYDAEERAQKLLVNE